MTHQQVIAVDFDGTLFVLDSNDELQPVPGAKEGLRDLRSQGYKIIIHTCRTGIAAQEGSLSQEVKLIKKTMEKHEMEFDEIFLGEKLIADIYVDDRSIPFRGDWKATQLEIVKELKKIGFT